MLTFRAGAEVGDVICVNYSIINDDIPEGLEDFRVTVSSNDGDRLRIDESGVVRVTITDDDGKCSSLTAKLNCNGKFGVSYCIKCEWCFP